MTDLSPIGSGARRGMRILFVVALVIGLTNAGVYIYGLTLPDEWHVAESVDVDAPAESIYPLIATPKRWSEWTTWSESHDPTLRLAFDGPESGEGASFSWLGQQLGRGTLTITQAVPNADVGYELVMQGETFSDNGRITLEPLEAGTRVTWTDGGDVGGTLGRIFRKRLEQSVAAEFAASLRRLKSVAERPTE